MGAVYDATWGRLFASFYDRILGRSERAGLGEMLRELLAGGSGRAIELGAGTGVNLELYPAAVTGLVALEPDPHMAKQLRAKLAASRRWAGGGAEIAELRAERLPYEDASFDLGVATLVLCTIPDPAAALGELRRVLKPGAPLLFIEHVRAADPRTARLQDRLEKPWRFLGDGCHCNRDTEATLVAAGFELPQLEHGTMPEALGFLQPLIRGRAMAG